ncbi:MULTISPECIES: hypothetical protein [Clostridium]|uniref:hypothetical protein n=1 Tax=Clostridium TaxID=1485 RepID=UPI0008248F7A|nr:MULTISPECIES: hypothetical protein [Clostridium]PJI06895.1 hypothetical protein CUB90_02995 [Clostridium sp. CT7]
MIVRELEENENEKWVEFAEKSLSKTISVGETKSDSCFKLVVETHDEIIGGLNIEGENKNAKLYVLPQYKEKRLGEILISAAKYIECQ